MQTAKNLLQIIALFFTWAVLFFVLTTFTELILAPWDTALHRPEVGTWQRTLNDFFEGSPGQFIISAPLLVLSVYTTIQAVRSRSTPIWKFIAGNLIFLVALWLLFIAAAGINNRILFPYPPVAYDPNYEGYHRSIFPLAVMLSACGVWYLWQRRTA